MKCVFCGGKMEKKKVTFSYEEKGKYFFIENVPAQVCTICGEKTFSARITDKLLQLANRSSAPTRIIKVPVMDFV